MTIDDMLSNAATASQNISLLESVVTRGALLRSIEQWLVADEEGDLDFLLFQLRNHGDYSQ